MSTKLTHTATTIALVALCITLMLFPEFAYATGSGGDEFQPIHARIVGWMQGYLGKIIACAFLLYGIGAGVLRGSLGQAVTAIAASLFLFFGPTIIDSIMGATWTATTVLAV